MPRWFETHAHLCDPRFSADRDEVVRRAFDAGVEPIVEIADGPDEWDAAAALAAANPGRVFWAAGLHPYYADKSSDEVWDRLAGFAARADFVAVGEIGLDYAKSSAEAAAQKAAFERGLAVARRINRPVIIHCREAFPDLLEILARWAPATTPSPGVVHCFTGSAADAEALVTMGFHLGVDGPVTYPSSRALREALKAAPLDRLVLETDSPYLPPQSRRGQRNEPALLPEVAAGLAALHGVSPDELSDITARNARRLFRLAP